MERRVLLSIFLAFLVLYVWQALFVKPVPKPVGGAAPAVASDKGPDAAPQSSASTNTRPAPAPNAAPVAPPAPPPPSAATLIGETSEREVRIETNDVLTVFTNRGGRIKSWRLKHFFDQNKQPLELVATELADTHPLPFSVKTPDNRVTTAVNSALYRVNGAPAANAAPGAVDLRFDYQDSSGVRASKHFHLDPSGYVIGFGATVTSGDRRLPIGIESGPAVGDISAASRYITAPEGLTFANGSVQRLTPKDIAKQSTYDTDFRYVGVDDHYFITVALAPGPSKVTYQPVSIPPPPNSKDQPRTLVAYSIEPAAADGLKFFFGPKDFDVLAAIDRDLVRAIDFGWFSVLVVPLLRSLKWVNGYVGNYGWSIVLLTIIINAIMFPLRHKSVVSMRKMQEIQPEVKAIQDRYAKLKTTDPAKQKMNQELMTLYKERGVNPASGCVPMLLTFPVLYAFYALLSKSIELRGAPFGFWIHDLSMPDPLFITPVLMGVSQLWMQRMTPTPAGSDPAQQKMMMFMPVMFTFFFLWAPAGLAIYYAVSNIWGIGQQYLTNYMIGPPNVRAVRPPAERRMKRVGGGKTDAAAKES
jgi:YidC/Oxa1 family membrane protein insertase